MPTIDDFVELNIDLRATTLSKPGFGTPAIAGYHTVTGNRSDEYASPTEMIDAGYTVLHPIYKKAAKIFSQKPRPSKIKILRRALPFTKTIKLSPLNTDEGFRYKFKVWGTDGVSTQIDYPVPAGATAAILALGLAQAVSDIYRTVTAVAATDLFTLAAHGFAADDPVKFSNTGGALPAGLVQGTVYYVIASGLTSSVFKVSATLGGATIDITTDGTGTNKVARDIADVVGVVASHTPADEFFTLAAAAGALFDITELPKIANLKVKDITADPGLASDLAAIYADDPDGWYGLLLDSTSEAEIAAAAAWAETVVGKLFLATSIDSEITDATVDDDIASDLQAASYSNTAVQVYTRSLMGGLDAGILGKLLPEKPGYPTWDFKTISAVVVDTLTGGQASAAKAKNAAIYTNVGGASFTQNMKTASGEWLDVKIFLDWIRVEIQFGILAAFLVNKRIPFTDDGTEIIVAVLEGIFKRSEEGPKNPLGPIAKASWSITVPKVADVSDSDKALRVLPDVNFGFTMAGAIHKVKVAGAVSQ